MLSSALQAKVLTICLLALSRIEDDPRVRRQGDAFARAGWQVNGIGLGGARSPGPAWRVISPRYNSAPPDRNARFARRSLVEWCADRVKWRAAKRALYGLSLLAVRLRPNFAHRLYWSANPAIRSLVECAREFADPVDLWVANDWNTLPLAAHLAKERGGVYSYDTHEFAVEEYAEKLSWRFWHRPMIKVLEAAFIRDAVVVSTVSASIAAELNRLYALPRPCLVVRNTPDFQSQPFRPTGRPIRVLYHGLVAPGRGLEDVVSSVAQWRSDFDLAIRGPGDSAYLAALQRHIDAQKVGNRVCLLPAVPMTDLIAAAAAFDIGLFALPATSRHNRFALPNKLFEYIMAGLALCVSNLPEMARLIDTHEVGITFDAIEPGQIASAINRFDRAVVDAYKRAALAAARTLCWEHEATQLVAAYDAACKRAAKQIPVLAGV